MLIGYECSAQSDLVPLSPEYNGFATIIDDELWFASGAEGVNRWNGVSNATYGLKDSLSGLDGSFMQSKFYKDAHDRIWTSTFENLCYYESATDQFNCFKVAWDGDTLRTGYHIIDHDHETNQLWIRADNQILIVDLSDLSVTLSIGTTIGAFFTKDNKRIIGCPWTNGEGVEVWRNDESGWRRHYLSFKTCPKIGAIEVMNATTLNQEMWLCTNKGLLLLDDQAPCDSKLFTYHSSKSVVTAIHPFGKYLILGTNNEGLQLFDLTFRQFVESEIPSLQDIDELFCDTLGNCFVSNYQEGIQALNINKYLPNRRVHTDKNRWKQLHTFPKALILSNDEELFISTAATDTIVQMDDLGLKSLFSGVDQFSNHELLVCDMRNCVTLDLESLQSKPYFNQPDKSIVAFKIYQDSVFMIENHTLSVYDQHARLLIPSLPTYIENNSVRGLGNIGDDVHSYMVHSTQYLIQKNDADTLLDLKSYINTAAVDSRKNRHYVGSNDGLFEVSKDLNVTPIDHPSLRDRKVTKLQLSNEYLYFLADSRIGRFYMPTRSVQMGRQYVDERIKDFVVVGDTLFIVSDMAYKLPVDRCFAYERFYFDVLLDTKHGSRMLDDAPIRIELGQEESTLKLKATVRNPMDGTPSWIQYRVNSEADNWRSINNGEPITIDIPLPGTYKIEVRAVQPDGVISKIRTIKAVKRLPWYKSIWFYLLLFSTAVALLYAGFRYRLAIINRNYRYESEIRNLEKSALQAQMNPHFIFNCLNSIQRFIIKNDKDNAMEYLATFATLIRKYLNASTKNTITIDEEITMLDHYLQLESLRFKDIFDYNISIDSALDPHTQQIPPMLVQPFVENAILHGMQGKSIGEGRIEVSFTKADHNFLITIKDNGPGISETIQNITHKSLGASITRRRLEHIKSSSGISHHLNIESSTEGTLVQLTLPL